MLEIKSVVVHFQGKVFTLAGRLHISLLMLGEDQLIRELKLGGVNHDRMRKWVKTVYLPETATGRLSPQREVDTT
jgi:hypothetical protein